MGKKKIAIIGHFGENEQIFDGQTVKTRILYEELTAATEWDILKVDTYYRRRKTWKLIFQTVNALVSTKDIIVLLSGNGMRFYFPILYYCAKLFGTRVYHDVIGGNLADYVRRYPAFVEYLNSFQINWVETNGLKKKLEIVGIQNSEVIPNFKRIPIVDKADIQPKREGPVYFCTFSRVMKEKGIEKAIDAVEQINEEYGYEICRLDIFGKIDDGYVVEFETKMQTVSPAIRYCGVVPFSKSTDVIKQYDVLLFPTYWEGEGFPGTIVDAFSAGLPVIATKWNCNEEIIRDGENGILYPNDICQTLADAIKLIVNQPQRLMDMKLQCIESAEDYRPEPHIQKIIKNLQSKAERK